MNERNITFGVEQSHKWKYSDENEFNVSPTSFNGFFKIVNRNRKYLNFIIIS